MSDQKSTPPAPEPESAPAAAKAPARPSKPAGPSRALPSKDEIAAWIQGEEVATIGALFDGIDTRRYDTLVTLVRKQDLLPQHWQVISRLEAPDDEEFHRLAEVDRLRRRYPDPELADQRVANLRTAWQELRGKRPALWTVLDLLAAMRRIIDRGREVDFTHLLSATRDVWADLGLPAGREQLALLGPCLALIRDKTK